MCTPRPPPPSPPLGVEPAAAGGTEGTPRLNATDDGTESGSATEFGSDPCMQDSEGDISDFGEDVLLLSEGEAKDEDEEEGEDDDEAGSVRPVAGTKRARGQSKARNMRPRSESPSASPEARAGLRTSSSPFKLERILVLVDGNFEEGDAFAFGSGLKVVLSDGSVIWVKVGPTL